MTEKPRVLLLHDNCLELDRPLTGGGFDFERKCLAMLASDFPNLLLLGPRLVEGVLLRMMYTGSQPDVMMFSQGARRWKLHAMAEIKVGSKIAGIEEKTEGMGAITNRLRGNPSGFIGALAFSLDGLALPIDVPDSLFVPPDKQIKVYFISPTNRFPQGKTRGCDFIISHRRYCC